MRSRVLVLLALAALSAGCLFDSKEARRGSVIENEVAGILFTENGDPAIGATVRVYEVGHVPKGGLLKSAADSEAVFSAITDHQGRYNLDSLPAGEYNLIAELDGALAYQDSLVVSASLDSLPTDTLGDPGSVTGAVTMQPNHDPRAVYVQVLGTNRFAATDTAGRFTLRNLGAGEYSLRIVTTLPDYSPLFTSVTVRSGRQDTLTTPFQMVYTGVPVVEGLVVAFDTVKSVARLSWKTSDYRFLKEYLVYRNDAASLEVPAVPVVRLKDTVFLDDLSPFLSDLPAGTTRRFEYRMKIRNVSDKEGSSFGTVAVAAVPRSEVRTAMTFLLPAGQAFRRSLSDSQSVIVKWKNPGRDQDSLHWYLGGAAAPLKAKSVSGRSGEDTLSLVLPGAAGAVFVKARMTDRTGLRWSDSISIEVVQDAPRADAGKDTLVSILDTVRLHGKATQEFGRIVRWEWDHGNRGVFTVYPTGEASARSAGTAGSEQHVLRVTDDDGNTGLDTVKVTIVQDLPIAAAGADTTVTPNDTLRLRGSGTDGFGRIMKLEWGMEGSSAFTEAESGFLVKLAGSTPGLEIHILKVTDDDGNTALDTLKVAVVRDSPTAMAGRDTMVTIGDQVHLHGRGTDVRGRIVALEWDIGAKGSFAPTAAGDTVYTAAGQIGHYFNVLRVTDDDGNSSLDTMRVTVINDYPLVKIAMDYRHAPQGGEYHLKATAVDSGEITKWEWDLGNTGFWSKASADTGFFPIAASGTMLTVKARATDEDGNYDHGTLTFEHTNWRYAGNFGTSDIPMAGVPDFFTVVECGGKIYCLGNRTRTDGPEGLLSEFDPATGRWAARSRMEIPTRLPSLASVNGKIYAFGGGGGELEVQEYDPAVDAWYVKRKSPYRNMQIGTVVLGGKILLIGGDDARFQEYNPITDAWLMRTVGFLAPGNRPGLAVHGGKIYGFNPDFILDPSTDAWSGLPWSWSRPMQVLTRFAAPIGDRIYMTGKIGDLKRTMHYYPAGVSEKWSAKALLPVQATAGSEFVAVGNRIFAFSPHQDSGPREMRIFNYSPADDP